MTRFYTYDCRIPTWVLLDAPHIEMEIWKIRFINYIFKKCLIKIEKHNKITIKNFYNSYFIIQITTLNFDIIKIK